jgi:hypothetical protein
LPYFFFAELLTEHAAPAWGLHGKNSKGINELRQVLVEVQFLTEMHRN